MVLMKNNLLLLVKNFAPLLPVTSLSLGSFLKEDYKAEEQIIGTYLKSIKKDTLVEFRINFFLAQFNKDLFIKNNYSIPSFFYFELLKRI